jgi:sugar phosphate isomerase/epimerase
MPKLCLGMNGFIAGESKSRIIRFASRVGFDGVELVPHYTDYSVKGEERKKTRKEFERFGLEIPAIQSHPQGLYNPASSNEKIRQKYVDAVTENIKFALDMGATNVGVWSFLYAVGTPYKEQIECLIDSYKRLATSAEQNNIVISMEAEPILITGAYPDVFPRIIKEVDSKYFKALFDFAHANITSNGDPIGLLKALTGKIGWVHVADNDGTRSRYMGTSKHLTIGEGNLDIEGMLKILREGGYNKWLEIDVWEHPKPFECAQKGKKALEKILKDISW